MHIQNQIAKTVTASMIALLFSISVWADSQPRHVFELFTSQGCYSCPPADELLGEIIDENDDILGLEFHVDYWDTLVYGSAGVWKDPFSSPAYSKRQRDYNALFLAGRRGVYTPQIVVNGDYAFVGSNKRQANKQLKRKSGWVFQTSADVSDSTRVKVHVDGNHDSDADIWLITYDKRHSTPVTSGENKDKVMNNFNVVRKFDSIGKWEGESVSIEVPIDKLGDNQNCAVIVQQYDGRRQTIRGPILGASICSES